MAWKKSPPELVALFDQVCPGAPAERRQMFGYPCAFLSGNMFVGTFQDQFWVRLDAEGRSELLAHEGAAPFEPMEGRPMKEYVVVPEGWQQDPDTLRTWVARAQEYASGLSPKRSR